jgi:hypothetical protein
MRAVAGDSSALAGGACRLRLLPSNAEAPHWVLSPLEAQRRVPLLRRALPSLPAAWLLAFATTFLSPPPFWACDRAPLIDGVRPRVPYRAAASDIAGPCRGSELRPSCRGPRWAASPALRQLARAPAAAQLVRVA